MAAIEDEKIYGLKIRESATDGSDFSNPDADYRLAFIGEDGVWHVKDSAGAVTNPFSGGGTAHGAVAVRTTDQTGVVTSTDTLVVFNGTDVFDTDGFHDPTTNASRMTIPTGLDGKYLVTASVTWDTNATGARQIWFKHSAGGGGVNGFVRAGGNANIVSLSSSAILALTAGQYVEVICWQDSGANRTLSGSIVQLQFSITWLGA